MSAVAAARPPRGARAAGGARRSSRLRPPARLVSQRRAASSTAAFVTCRSSSRRATSSSSTRRPHFPLPCRRCAPTESSSSSGSPLLRPAAIPTATGSSSYATATSRSAPSTSGEELALPAGATARILAPYAGTAALARAPRSAADRSRPTSPSTGNRSGTATCRSAGRSPRTRTSTPPSPVAPRCRARGDPSRPS